MNNLFGGGGGSTDPLASSDPSGGSDLGTLFSSLGQAFAGGGANPASSPTGTVDAIQQATDPTGSIGAQTAITGGQNTPQPTQNQNPQGPQGGQGGGQDQFAPPSAVDALKKALQGLRQQQRQNPYAFPNSNSPMLNRAGRIPTDQVPPAPAQPDDPNAPSQYAQNMEFMNDNSAPPSPNAIDPADAVRAGLRSNAPDTSGQFKMPGPANENTQTSKAVAPTNTPPATTGGATPPTEGGDEPTPALPPPSPDSSGGLGGLATLARMMGIGAPAVGGAGFLLPFMSTPAETGEMPRQTLGRSPTGPAPPPALGGGPGNEEEAPTGTPVTKASVTGKKVETVDPKTKKPVDPKTGDPLPTKKGDLPTKKGHYEPTTGDARDKTWHPDGAGPIMRDVSGVSHGVPQGLGELARMAMPLLMMAMGGMGGGGRGRHGRGFGGFHPGGRGHWPYHHPNFGWATHGFHPGGGWRPMSPVHFRQMRAEVGGGGGMDPQAMSALLGGGGGFTSGDTGVSNAGMNKRGQGGGGSNPWNYSDPQTQGPWSANPFLNTVVGAESTGRNSGAPGQGPGGDGGIARGFYNIQTPTWGEFARGVPGASQYASADQAPPDIQTQVAMTIPARRFGERTRAILHEKFGNFDERMTLGQLADQFGGQDWAANKPKPGTTTTGGSKAPNPTGNPATLNPYANAPAITQLGPEA
jgi:hypothetical protein